MLATVYKFLGFLIDSYRGWLVLTERKETNLMTLLNRFSLKNSCKIVDFAKLLGELVTAFPAVEYGWLYTKAMESQKLEALSNTKGNYNGVMHLSELVKKIMNWWIHRIPGAKKSFRLPDFTEVIFTDASVSGWGATDGVKSFHRVWSTSQYWSISYKELYNVKIALEKLAPETSRSHLLLRIDNETAISYVNKIRRVRFEKFSALVRVIWQLTEKRENFLKASYIPSREKKEADALSRLSTLDTEWELSDRAFTRTVDTFSVPEVDIFASALNAKSNNVFSWLPDPRGTPN